LSRAPIVAALGLVLAAQPVVTVRSQAAMPQDTRHVTGSVECAGAHYAIAIVQRGGLVRIAALTGNGRAIAPGALGGAVARLATIAGVEMRCSGARATVRISGTLPGDPARRSIEGELMNGTLGTIHWDAAR
jgi:hypothetical protein